MHKCKVVDCSNKISVLINLSPHCFKCHYDKRYGKYSLPKELYEWRVVPVGGAGERVLHMGKEIGKQFRHGLRLERKR